MVIKFVKKYRIQFENLPQQLKCCICREILKNAYQVKCGCKVCQTCIDEYLKNGPRICPCNECDCNYIITNINERENIFPDKATDKDISNIPMKCPFNACPVSLHLKQLQQHIIGCLDREKFCEICQFKMIFKNHQTFGCDTKIEFCESCANNLRFWQFHDEENANNNEIIKNYDCSLVTHINECEYREIFCDKCKDKILLNEKYDHDQLFCTMRIIFCSFCFTKMSFNYYNEIHFNIDSGNLCNNYMDICPNHCNHTEQVNLKQHLKFCSKKKQNCLFSHFDCKEDKMTKDDLMKHKKQRVIKHSLSPISKIKEMDETIENQTNIRKSINKEFKEIFKRNQEFQINSERIMKELSNQIPNIISNVKNECTNRNGNFIWKFSEFDKHLIEAERGERISFTSDPFYTSEFGYKMCLRIYPAGDGIGKGTHLSVFFAIMKGEFDDLLTWPFKQKVTLSILDQEYNVKHHSETFKPDSRTRCYQKPKDVCNVASGSPKFIPLTLINNNSSYCRKNTIYFEISVDTSGINNP